MLKFQSNALTDVGKVRKHNEDSFLEDPELGLYVVCDGMGGHQAGEVASQLACQTLRDYLKRQIQAGATRPNREKAKASLREGILAACERVFQDGNSNPEHKGMGTTLVSLLTIDDRVILGHIGDSRIYLMREGKIHQLTQDHSLVNELVQKGIMTKEAAMKHPQANVITKAIGIAPVVEPDILEFEIMPGDRFLLCSDGLSKHVTDEKILSIAHQSKLAEVNNLLIQSALSAGGTDNITAILLGVEDEQKQNTRTEGTNILVTKKIDTLKRIPLFSSMDFGQLSKVLEVIEVKSFSESETIIKQGDSAREMFIILQGKAEVSKDGHIINRLGPGAYFGEMALIDDAPRSASITSTEKTKVLALEQAKLFRLLEQNSDMAKQIYWFFLQTLSKRLREKEEELLKLNKLHGN